MLLREHAWLALSSGAPSVVVAVRTRVRETPSGRWAPQEPGVLPVLHRGGRAGHSLTASTPRLTANLQCVCDSVIILLRPRCFPTVVPQPQPSFPRLRGMVGGTGVNRDFSPVKATTSSMTVMPRDPGTSSEGGLRRGLSFPGVTVRCYTGDTHVLSRRPRQGLCLYLALL